MIYIKSEREIEKMRRAGEIVFEALNLIESMVRPGITTKELDIAAEKFILLKKATPSFKGYGGFPGSICASLNNEVVHGIPSDKVILKDGDIISIDIGAIVDGYHGDAARTFPVGNVDEETMRLIKVTEESFFEGIKYAKEGHRLTDISHAIQEYVEKHGYSVVRDYVGHGIGKSLHEDPQIPHFGPPNRGPRLKKGMVLAIEPMVNMGTFHVKVLEDDWTVITRDGKLSSHYENTVLITEGEPELLTLVER